MFLTSYYIYKQYYYCGTAYIFVYSKYDIFKLLSLLYLFLSIFFVKLSVMILVVYFTKLDYIKFNYK